MDENNNYVNAIKNPLLYGCIKKQQKNPSLCELNVILNNLTLKMKTKTKAYLMKCKCQYLKKAS